MPFSSQCSVPFADPRRARWCGQIDWHAPLRVTFDPVQFVHPSTGGPGSQQILLPRDGTYRYVRTTVQAALDA